ncbi:class III extradiol dioxygenase subunit B-like domain-containing protein [Micromonospora polyrhachis]|uniref:class III extradiol dioxygenase subunit B-like domain-containing protein n=1 Tax=Micromonospora polyrhachis TaxID=1282883 RepID=UPI00160B023C|nr:class III extradiol dioxygenase subunit B-like domain-containing protein [Micromonospora polyrhachis]
MPLVAAAVCPHPPLIVPEIAGTAAPELDDLRAACAAAVGRLLAAEPDVVFVVGGGPETIRLRAADYGSLRPYGLDRRIHLSKVNCAGGPRLPLSVQIGAWLMHRGGAKCLRLGQAVAPDEPAIACARIGAQLAAEFGNAANPGSAAGSDHATESTGRAAGSDRRVALLVMGDGSACRGEKAPGYADPRARSYDDGVASALAGADPDALLSLDPGLSAELLVAGRAPWQVLAGAVRAAGGAWRGELTYYAVPYGVAYFVAEWLPA